ncbi:MAG TPA: FG-GAP-like repeat-containing protein [candidate division Zixibacteria bacterium]|nr:FG-GAP-like repeat-containing protein [candidate division Zixibacteria bacterium]
MKQFLLGFILGLVVSASVSAQLPDQFGELVADSTNTLFGYHLIPVGDINCDDYPDLLVWDYRWANFLYFGGPTLDTTADFVFHNTGSGGGAVGDQNGDGCPDLILTTRSSANYRLNMYYTGTLLDTLRDLWFGVDTPFASANVLEGHDLNANGTDEFVAAATSIGAGFNTVLGFELGPNSDSIPDFQISPITSELGYQFGEGLVVGDFNGDGQSDLAVSYRPRLIYAQNGSVYLYWGGPSFDTIPDMIITRPGPYQSYQEYFGVLLVNLGDFNGDGYNDIFVGSTGPDSTNYIYFGGPSIDTIPDLIIRGSFTKAHAAGDLNQDGYGDLITSFSTSLQNVGNVRIYFGGPSADSLPDIQIYGSQFPQLLTYFGQDCAAIGDFNGDGRNDFAFSAVGADLRGHVFLFSGPEPSTDVHYDYDPGLPSGFSLSQNYPNPFNPSTTIEFEVPRRSGVTLSIYNVLGQEVRQLIDNSLSAGTYRLEWDGKSAGGRFAGSGVYFYKLTSGNVTLSRKMVLLR